MNWWALATAAISKIPIERFIVKPRSRTEALREMREILEQAPRGERTSEPSHEGPEETIVQRRPKQYLPRPRPESVSSEVTVEYQNREIGKLLLRMERHYAQRLRINDVPCDCGSQKHLLDLESLCEETIPMVDNPEVYYRIVDWIREVGPKSTDEAAKSGYHDEEYPHFAHEARDFRKELIGTLEASALFPKRLEGRVGSTILPIVSEEEREEVSHEVS